MRSRSDGQRTKAHKRNVAEAGRCACGCGKATARTFAIGHDAKAKSMILKVGRGEMKSMNLPRSLRALRKGDGMIAKMLRRLEAR